MDCIITFKIFFKILGTLTLHAFLNEFKNSFTTALLQRGPFQNVHCRVAAHSSCNYSGSPVLEGFKALKMQFCLDYTLKDTRVDSSNGGHFSLKLSKPKTYDDHSHSV